MPGFHRLVHQKKPRWKEKAMADLAQEFVEALAKLEGSGDLDALVRLFEEDADVSNPLVTDQRQGQDSPERFWRDYRDAFDDIQSDFRHVMSQDGTTFLEWQSRGSINGQRFDYGGVSVLETKEGRITAFRSYFDPAKLPSAHATPGNNNDADPPTGPGSAAGKPQDSELDRAQEEMAEQRAEGGYQ
jgi:ketosteroid isomerase-like protein